MLYLSNIQKQKTAGKFFKAIVILKGIHAIIEILLGVALFILSKDFISNAIVSFVDGRLVGDPNGFVAQYISQFGIDLSLSIKLFFSIYLLTHGLVNFSLVYAVTKKPSIAYPISLVVFIGFLIYQIYDYFVSSSLWMLLIIIVDILFIVLLFYEYNRHLKEYSFLGRLKLIIRSKLPKIVEIKIPGIGFIKMQKI